MVVVAVVTVVDVMVGGRMAYPSIRSYAIGSHQNTPQFKVVNEIQETSPPSSVVGPGRRLSLER